MPAVKVALRFREERCPATHWSCGPCGDTQQAALSFNSSACDTGLKSLTLPVWAQLPEISILARVRPHLFHTSLHKECQRRGDLNLIIRVSAHDGLFPITSIPKTKSSFRHLSCETPHSLGGSADWDDGSLVDAFKLCLARMRVYRTLCFRRLLQLETEQGALEEHWVRDKQLNALHVRAHAHAAQEAL